VRRYFKKERKIKKINGRRRIIMGLTAKQEAFCKAIALEGKTQSDAYRDAYDAENMKDEVIYVKASELAAAGKVKVRIAELKASVDEKVIEKFAKSREKILQEFEDLILAAKTDDDKKEIRECLKEQGKLLGYYEQTVNLKGTLSVVAGLKEFAARAKKKNKNIENTTNCPKTLSDHREIKS
jgi:phage terminase small subunit